MHNRISKKTLWGIMVLTLVCTIITLGLRIYLKDRLDSFEMESVAETLPHEKEEQLIFTAIEEISEPEEELLEKYNSNFEEIDTLYERISTLEQDESLKDNYQKIADLWDRELKALGNDITAKMPEGEKKTFFDGENTFLVSRNHECMKAVGQNKVSIQERIDYLDRYIVMTREHCKDLVKEYTSYLAT